MHYLHLQNCFIMNSLSHMIDITSILIIVSTVTISITIFTIFIKTTKWTNIFHKNSQHSLYFILIFPIKDQSIIIKNSHVSTLSSSWIGRWSLGGAWERHGRGIGGCWSKRGWAEHMRCWWSKRGGAYNGLLIQKLMGAMLVLKGGLGASWILQVQKGRSL